MDTRTQELKTLAAGFGRARARAADFVAGLFAARESKFSDYNRRGLRAERARRRRRITKVTGDSNPAKRFPLGDLRDAPGGVLSHQQRHTEALIKAWGIKE